MKDWVLSQVGEKWTVKLDVRYFGGHLDTHLGRLVCYSCCPGSAGYFSTDPCFHSSIGFPWYDSGGQDTVRPRCSPWH